ncbi:hypothetical protein RAH42_10605 [Pyramidobacter sp. YE332]|uniref:hypothetical protein n=1 Tax=Pyramidobacter sp. YE332 TaxID=3068894 RepID=UPI00294AA5FA|nr:hypothetical protein [Pyramidobacter sp. YE332]WOL39579.1 hypothetical protein RAH42_10605 [Pyramidobacter sp. YE332]
MRCEIRLSSYTDWASETERCLRDGQSVVLVPDDAEAPNWGLREILNLALGLFRLDRSCPEWRGGVSFGELKCDERPVLNLYRSMTGGVAHGA